MVIIGLSQVSNNNLVPDFVRSNLRGSKFNIFLAGGGGGGGGGGRGGGGGGGRGGGVCPQTPLVGTHATIILLPSCSPPPPPPPPPQLKILYETLFVVTNPLWQQFHLFF